MHIDRTLYKSPHDIAHSGSLLQTMMATVVAAIADQLVVYRTYKTVAIRDPRLGLLKLFFLSAICVYIIQGIFTETRYLAKERPTGTVRFGLREPVLDSVSGLPCNPLTEFTCENTIPSKVDIPYCMVAKFKRPDFLEICDTSDLFNSCPPCTYKDAFDVMDNTETAVQIATSTQVYSQQSIGDASCATLNGPCPELWDTVYWGEGFPQYVPGIENFTLSIDHTMSTSREHRNSRSMAGRLSIPNNDAYCSSREGTVDRHGDPTDSAPCFINPRTLQNFTDQDIFPVSDILAAGDIDLDGSTRGNETIRFNGIQVVFEISYSNFEPWASPLKDFSYTYTVTQVPGTVSKFIRKEFFLAQPPRALEADTDSRYIIINRGVKLHAVFGGQIGYVSIFDLLVQLATSIALLAIANAIVNFLANILPQRKEYLAATEETTKVLVPDLSVWGKIARWGLAEAAEETGQEPGGDEEDVDFLLDGADDVAGRGTDVDVEMLDTVGSLAVLRKEMEQDKTELHDRIAQLESEVKSLMRIIKNAAIVE